MEPRTAMPRRADLGDMEGLRQGHTSSSGSSGLVPHHTRDSEDREGGPREPTEGGLHGWLPPPPPRGMGGENPGPHTKLGIWV